MLSYSYHYYSCNTWSNDLLVSSLTCDSRDRKASDASDDTVEYMALKPTTLSAYGANTSNISQISLNNQPSNTAERDLTEFSFNPSVDFPSQALEECYEDGGIEDVEHVQDSD